ncbi:MAG: alkylresorcinol/alkylpyrone synthase [Thermoplasmata archaeon]|jgi:alkylresorcinol/alkylpyrone synthase|nr:alkylresorcinol/alkylpyrone synthase [Thermoplasmata archaeon]
MWPSLAVVHPVATTTPPHRLRQAELREVAAAMMPEGAAKRNALELFDHPSVAARALAMPIEWYLAPHGFRDRNAAYVDAGLPLVEAAAREAIATAGLAPQDIGAVLFVSTTGLATPSLDARLAGRLGLRPDTLRVPVWGLGCAGGVAALNRAADLVRARPGLHVLAVALELCSLSFDAPRAMAAGQGGDKKAVVAASLFGDGCAAVVVSGQGIGARHEAGASHLFPGTERVMGWDVEDGNLDVVLSPRIPDIVRAEMANLVRPFVAGRRVDAWVLHPGGAKVLEAYRDALGLSSADLAWSEEVLRAHGNMSSPTVLFALQAWQRSRPAAGSTALLAALGPGFASELALVVA